MICRCVRRLYQVAQQLHNRNHRSSRLAYRRFGAVAQTEIRANTRWSLQLN